MTARDARRRYIWTQGNEPQLGAKRDVSRPRIALLAHYTGPPVAMEGRCKREQADPVW